MTEKKIVDIENEELVYQEYIDNFQRFCSKKKQRNEVFQKILQNNHQFKTNEKQLNALEQLDVSKQQCSLKRVFSEGSERWLVSKRFRQEYLENVVDEKVEAEKNIKNLQKIMRLLHHFHLQNSYEGELSIIKHFGTVLLEKITNTPKIENNLRKKIKHFYQELEKLVHILPEIDQQEALLEILNCEN
jgi:hypothetical protein